MRDDLDLESRELCSDGGCIGVIGADGKCKVCGAPGSGKPFRTAAGTAEDEDDDERSADAGDDEEDEAGEDEGDGEVEAAAGPSAPTGDRVWDDRRLCRDGSCIGLIGEDGNCKVCGTRA